MSLYRDCTDSRSSNTSHHIHCKEVIQLSEAMNRLSLYHSCSTFLKQRICHFWRFDWPVLFSNLSGSVRTTHGRLRGVKWLFIFEKTKILLLKWPSLPRKTLCVNAPECQSKNLKYVRCSLDLQSSKPVRRTFHGHRRRAKELHPGNKNPCIFVSLILVTYQCDQIGQFFAVWATF